MNSQPEHIPLTDIDVLKHLPSSNNEQPEHLANAIDELSIMTDQLERLPNTTSVFSTSNDQQAHLTHTNNDFSTTSGQSGQLSNTTKSKTTKDQIVDQTSATQTE